MMKTNFTVEELRPSLGPDEINDIVELYEALSPEHGKPGGKIIRNVIDQANSNIGALFVARLKTSRIASMAGVHLVQKGLYLEARLEDVATIKKYEGNGMARAVISACIDWAQDMNAEHLELTSAPVRSRANEMYQEMGFKLRETNVRRLSFDGSQDS